MGFVNGNKFKVTVKHGNDPKSNYVEFDILKVGTAYSSRITVTKWPTGNCQLSSIGYMNALVYYEDHTPQDVNAIIRECYKMIDCLPLLILVDVQQAYVPKVEQCFKIMHKHLYISTNSSAMCLFMVQLLSETK
jgi:hypothetical protein